MKIALDARGGDFGPPSLVGGAVMALREYQHINKLFLVGDSAKIETELKKHRCNDSRIDIVHSSQVVEMSDRAVEAVRRKKDSSVSRAVDLVKKGEASAIAQRRRIRPLRRAGETAANGPLISFPPASRSRAACTSG